jgi:hypothetical protein
MVAGIIMIYFMVAAFKLELLNIEMLIHSAIRFITGFILLGIGVFYAHTLRFKSAVIVVLILVLADDILDYTRGVYSFSFEIMIYSIFMLLWGALVGYLVMKNLREGTD